MTEYENVDLISSGEKRNSTFAYFISSGTDSLLGLNSRFERVPIEKIRLGNRDPHEVLRTQYRRENTNKFLLNLGCWGRGGVVGGVLIFS